VVFTPVAATSGGISVAPPSRHRWFLTAVLLVVFAVGGVWLVIRLQGSGDPGGEIMKQLAPAATALPGYGTSSLPWASQPSTSQPYLIKTEPHRDSCDGMAGTQGWSQVVVQGSFRWSGSHDALFEKVDAGMTAIGWHQTPVRGPDEAMWKKRLVGGSTATAMVDLSPLGDPDWEFVALAPPAGQAASGC
jgi:hypothetical protein